MDRLTAMEAFVRVVETGSFTRAAGQLRLSRAMVSKYVQELENRLGVRLLNRTTRRLSLTEAGAAYYERCARIVADAAEADQVAARLNLSPQGLLKINAPMSFGTRHLAPAIPDFIAAYPAISVEMTQNDHLVDLLEEGYDVAVRIGRLADSSLVARRIAPCRLVICASPTMTVSATPILRHRTSGGCPAPTGSGRSGSAARSGPTTATRSGRRPWPA